MSVSNTHFGYNKINDIMRSCREKSVFFIGAGGIMMSSLALLTKSAGYETSGSDRTPTKLTARLEDAGIKVYYSHDESNLGDNCGAVVYTVAISESNPEFMAELEGLIREKVATLGTAEEMSDEDFDLDDLDADIDI